MQEKKFLSLPFLDTKTEMLGKVALFMHEIQNVPELHIIVLGNNLPRGSNINPTLVPGTNSYFSDTPRIKWHIFRGDLDRVFKKPNLVFRLNYILYVVKRFSCFHFPIFIV